MKDVEFEDWRLTAFWIAVAAAAAIAGFVFGWCWRDRTGALADVSFLDALTAVGTVGATSAALYFGLRDQIRESDLRKQKLTSVLNLVEEAVQSAQWVIEHLEKRSDPELRAKVPLAKNEISAYLASMDAINRIPFHEPHFSEAHRGLISVLGVLRSLTPLISAYGDGPDDGNISPTMWGLGELVETELDTAREKAPFKGLSSVGRLYF